MDFDSDGENSLAKTLSSAGVQGVYLSTKDSWPLPVIGFTLKGDIITSAFFFFLIFPCWGREQQEAKELEEKKIASEPGNSDRRGYTGEAEDNQC